MMVNIYIKFSSFSKKVKLPKCSMLHTISQTLPTGVVNKKSQLYNFQALPRAKFVEVQSLSLVSTWQIMESHGFFISCLSMPFTCCHSHTSLNIVTQRHASLQFTTDCSTASRSWGLLEVDCWRLEYGLGVQNLWSHFSQTQNCVAFLLETWAGCQFQFSPCPHHLTLSLVWVSAICKI